MARQTSRCVFWESEFYEKHCLPPAVDIVHPLNNRSETVFDAKNDILSGKKYKEFM